jgi:Peptidase family M20/M25/M40
MCGLSCAHGELLAGARTFLTNCSGCCSPGCAGARSGQGRRESAALHLALFGLVRAGDAVALHSGGAPIHLRKDAFLAAAETGAREASEKAARAHHVQVTWTRTWDIPPRLFDETLLGFVRESVREVTGRSPELPSGPLHDAAEMVPLMPTAMIFAQSSPGVSHTRIEDTPEPALDASIQAFLRTVDKTLAHFGA